MCELIHLREAGEPANSVNELQDFDHVNMDWKQHTFGESSQGSSDELRLLKSSSWKINSPMRAIADYLRGSHTVYCRSSRVMTASFPEASAAISVISAWRLNGTKAAMSFLESVLLVCMTGLPPGALLLELQARLDGRPGPRLLIDGLWFNRPYGGITRVWEQILSTWQLPGFLSDDAPVGIINRGSHLSLIDSFPSFKAKSINPLDPQAIASIADENGDFVRSWRADVFCSSWISSSGLLSPSCPELALVHDCRRTFEGQKESST